MQDTKLDALIKYWGSNRQVGHTFAGLAGVLCYGRPIIYITSEPEARQLRAKYSELKNINFMSTAVLTNGGEKLHGFRLPLVIDHYAMSMIVLEHKHEYEKRYTEWLKERDNADTELRDSGK